MEGDKPMLNNQIVENSKVLVELSVIPLGGNGQNRNQVTDVQNIVKKTGLFYEQTQNGTCIEGQWSDICALLYSCYERVHDQSPQSFLKIDIR